MPAATFTSPSHRFQPRRRRSQRPAQSSLTLEGQATLDDFQVQLFEENEKLLPFPCYQDEGDEENTWADNDLAIRDLTQGTVSAGNGGPFTVTLPVPLYSTGPVLFCAYTTDEFVDTVSWSTGQITVTGASTTGAKPANTKLPGVTRSDRRLECTRGSWSGHPTSYRYRWVVLHKAGVSGRQHGLGVTGAMRGHRIECSVTATNSAGSATATSLPFKGHPARALRRTRCALGPTGFGISRLRSTWRPHEMLAWAPMPCRRT